jgi:RNA polymerase sigma factor (TIGR02999 family)
MYSQGRSLDDAGEITALLRQWSEDKSVDTDQLFELVYPDLRAIAGSLFRRERSENILQPTSVVNELFLRLVQIRKLSFQDRQHFYSFAARVMRRVLVDHARSEKRHKRDGGTQVPLLDSLAWYESNPEEILDIDRALQELETLDRRKCQMVEMRFLLGFTAEETAELMHLSKASVDRDLRFARSWLHLRMKVKA